MMGDTVDKMNWQRRMQSALTESGYSYTEQDKQAEPMLRVDCQ